MDEAVWKILGFYIIPMIVTLILNIGEPGEGALFLALIPLFNYVGAVISIFQLIRRSFISKGKCILQHDFEMVPEKNVHTIRMRVGGYERY